MDIPQPPEDAELRTIIDKLAQFVARNGPVFEEMTKKKQKGNPKFQFVYGGEYYNYYRYKVSSEQAIVKQQHPQQPQSSLDNELANNWSQSVQVQLPTSQPNVEIDHIIQQQDTLREQIKQSEQNLTAQHTVLLQQQQSTIEAVVAKCETSELHKLADESGILVNELYGILQPIIDSCTKDSISNGKSWFLQHSDTKSKCVSVVQCLLYKVLRSSTFNQKLHVIYLVNDLLHHSARKNANDLKDALEVAVVPMFCSANLMANEEQKVKLDKLLKLWESKANYLSISTLDKLHNPIESFQQYQADQMAKFANEVAAVTQQTNTTFDSYQSQHQAFVCHAMQQIMDLQQQKQNLEQKQQQQQQRMSMAPPPPQPLLNSNNIIPLETIQATLQQTIQSLSQSNNAVSGSSSATPSNSGMQQQVIQSQFPPIQPNGDANNSFIQMNPNVPPPHLAAQLQNAPNLSQIGSNNLNQLPLPDPQHQQQQSQPPPQQPPPSNGMESQFSQPPPGYFPPPGMFPDFSKPPPGFAPPKSEQHVDDLMPTAPYYDLPAGLMVPLVKLEDTEYKPLDPKDIRLPPPAPPSERLLAAVDAFYSLPSHERPRDSEGWEKLGLYEYYRAKNLAKKDKDDAILAGLREESRSPSPLSLKEEKENSPPKRRYCSKSPSPQPPSATTTATTTTTSLNPLVQPISQSSHHQSSQSHHHHHGGKSSRNRRSRSRGSRSRSRSRSRSPRRRSRMLRENRRRRSYTRSRSRSRSPPPRKSISPMKASFNSGSNILRSDTQELDSSNKGHEMLRKMGWGGKGLGANEQGIDAPIQGGDVRDRQDQFKGVGCNLNDPYENFRKNKGAAFITRMKARAEEREKEINMPSKSPLKKKSAC